MFAILINQENVAKIPIESFTNPEDLQRTLNLCLALKRRWYFVRGFVDNRGRFYDWVTLPHYIIEEDYEYDANKIQTDWDQIVRM